LSDDDSEDDSEGLVYDDEFELNAETEAVLQNVAVYGALDLSDDDSEDVSEDDSEDDSEGSVSGDGSEGSMYEDDSSVECDNDMNLESEDLSSCSDSDYEAEESDDEDKKVCVQYSSKIRQLNLIS
jgi:hypothetical protein